MKPVLDRNTVTCKAETHVKLKKRHVKITGRPKGFFRHLSNSCYASHPILYKAVEVFPILYAPPAASHKGGGGGMVSLI